MKTVNLRPTLHYISFILLLMFYYERYINLDVYMSLAGSSAHLATAKILSLITLVALFLSLVFGNRLTTLIALICTSFVQYESIYGADTMAYNLLLFSCFISHKKKNYDFTALLGVLILFVSLNVIYLYNAIAKIHDANWAEGRMLTTVLADFTPKKIFVSETLLNFTDPIVSYGTILLQLSIVLIFLKPTRKLISLCFIFCHLLIALQLPYFGLLCVVTHLFVMAYTGDIFKDLTLNIRNTHD